MLLSFSTKLTIWLDLQTMQRHRVAHDRFTRLSNRLLQYDPPCMSSATDWEEANGWADDLGSSVGGSDSGMSSSDALGELPVPLPTQPVADRSSWCSRKNHSPACPCTQQLLLSPCCGYTALRGACNIQAWSLSNIGNWFHRVHICVSWVIHILAQPVAW